MSPTNQTPIAEAADQRWYLLALMIFLLGLKSALSAAMVLVDQPYQRYLGWAEAVAALSAVAIVLLLVVFKFVRVPRDQRQRFLDMEGYVKETSLKACRWSWSATLITLMLFTVVFDEQDTSMPAEFHVQTALAVMLGVFSVAFFVMNRSSDDEGVAGA